MRTTQGMNESEKHRMINLLVHEPLTYRPNKDDRLIAMGWMYYDEEDDTVNSTRFARAAFYLPNGQINDLWQN